ncbi:thiazole tautomerase (transcriptional regulator TenI) [Cytobacillus firmus]|uniref:Thiamine-phosphate synthase n=2 Tax=Cytobacillus TaxID=2675230 RepID=A0A366JPX1_CYTFI|nr:MULTISPECIES: thiazole tautomerase TenI [Cytobacillus]RBP90123.1 thiazole tautomerase (transcriptional regulator TenI) [Cytobacillus firmus]TDX40571.1 thiazole tautomerase (transcriptional regulator TenI) [Cytobacillus oceanisediminis]
MKKQLHVISDGKLSLEAFAEIAGKVAPFADKFHLREKNRTSRELYEGVELLCNEGIPIHKIVINDRVDVAWTCKTGVHLAFHSLPVHVVKTHFLDMPIGCSVHSLEEAEEAAKQGADYVLFGHIFRTDSKKGVPPRGTGSLQALKKAVEIPVLAIGGIKPEKVPEVLEAGADGIAVMSGILQAKDPVEAAKLFSNKLNAEGK